MKPILQLSVAAGILILAACSDDTSSNGAADVTVDASGGTNDAAVDAATAVCGGCHGDSESLNPPPNVAGETDRSARGVGAHAQHLVESDWHLSVRCNHCHTVPEDADEDGHIDEERPADVVFSGLAASRGLSAAWDGSACTVYCHGAALGVVQNTSPEWTSTEPLGCDGCHGAPPGAPHPASTDCNRCHTDVVDEDGNIAIDYFHIDSVLQAPHGAHLVHLGGAGGPDFSCPICHDGGNVHGPLNDGNALEDTTICDGCHMPGAIEPLSWRTYDTIWD